MRRGKGYKPDPAGHRKTPFRHLAARLAVTALPLLVSLADLSPVFDQGQTGSCTGHATAGAVMVRFGRDLGFVPSPTGIYTTGIALDRDLNAPLLDLGAEPNQVVRGLAIDGVRAIGPMANDGRNSDADWPIPPDGSDPVVPDPTLLQIEASTAHLVVGPYAITSTGEQRKTDIKTALANGYAIMCAVDASDPNGPLQSYTSGVLDTLGTTLDHYVLIVGYEVTTDATSGLVDLVLTVRNSWGGAWGEAGNFRIRGAAIDQLGDLYVLDGKLEAAS